MINKIGLIMGIIGLLLSIYWGVAYYNNKRDTKLLIAKGEQKLVDLEKAAKLREDSIAQEVKKRDTTIKNLTIAENVAKEHLNEAVKISKSLAADLKKAKVNKDTTDYYAKCDSLADQVVVLEVQNESYQNKVAILNETLRKQITDKDTLLASKSRLYADLREAFNGNTLKINDLEKQKEQLNMKLQRSHRTTRLVAIIGAALAGSVYLSTR